MTNEYIITNRRQAWITFKQDIRIGIPLLLLLMACVVVGFIYENSTYDSYRYIEEPWELIYNVLFIVSIIINYTEYLGNSSVYYYNLPRNHSLTWLIHGASLFLIATIANIFVYLCFISKIFHIDTAETYVINIYKFMLPYYSICLGYCISSNIYIILYCIITIPMQMLINICDLKYANMAILYRDCEPDHIAFDALSLIITALLLFVSAGLSSIAWYNIKHFEMRIFNVDNDSYSQTINNQFNSVHGIYNDMVNHIRARLLKRQY